MTEKRKFKVLMFFPWNSESSLNWRTLLEVGFSERAVEFEYEYVGGENDRPIVQKKVDWDLVVTELYPEPTKAEPRENELLRRQPELLEKMLVIASEELLHDAVFQKGFSRQMLQAQVCYPARDSVVNKWKRIVASILFKAEARS